MGSPNLYAGIKQWKQVKGDENQIKLLGGYFEPNGSSAPTAISSGSSRWEVSRVATGRFLVTLLGTLQGNAVTSTTLGKIQSILATLQVDSAGSVQTLGVVVGPVTGSSFELDVVNTATDALTDISQPGSPAAQGTFVHWMVQISNDNTSTYQLPSLAN